VPGNRSGLIKQTLSRSLLGVKRTSHFAMYMSASDPKRTWPLPALLLNPIRWQS
jgi:hypothetical protein